MANPEARPNAQGAVVFSPRIRQVCEDGPAPNKSALTSSRALTRIKTWQSVASFGAANLSRVSVFNSRLFPEFDVFVWFDVGFGFRACAAHATPRDARHVGAALLFPRFEPRPLDTETARRRSTNFRRALIGSSPTASTDDTLVAPASSRVPTVNCESGQTEHRRKRRSI